MIEKGVCSVTARKWMTKGKNAGLKCQKRLEDKNETRKTDAAKDN